MAQRSATCLLVGSIVRTERKSGSFADREDPTRQVSFDYIEARLLTPEFDMVEVRFPSNGSIPVPSGDEQVTLRCDVRPSAGNIKVSALAVVATAPSLV